VGSFFTLSSISSLNAVLGQSQLDMTDLDVLHPRGMRPPSGHCKTSDRGSLIEVPLVTPMLPWASEIKCLQHSIFSRNAPYW